MGNENSFEKPAASQGNLGEPKKEVMPAGFFSALGAVSQVFKNPDDKYNLVGSLPSSDLKHAFLAYLRSYMAPNYVKAIEKI